jgi:hypothetical protein
MAKSDRGSRGAPKDKGKRMRTEMQGDAAAGAPIDPRVNEPVPDKFMELLQKLERSTTDKR